MLEKQTRSYFWRPSWVVGWAAVPVVLTLFIITVLLGFLGPDRLHDQRDMVFAIAIVSVFIFWTIFAVGRAVRFRAPVIVLSQTGFMDTRISNALAPWEAVSSLEHVISRNQQYIMVTLSHASRVSAGLHSRASLLYRIKSAFGFDDIYISTMGLQTTLSDLHLAMFEMHSFYRASELDTGSAPVTDPDRPLRSDVAAQDPPPFPWATVGLIVILTVVYVAEVLNGDAELAISPSRLLQFGGVIHRPAFQAEWWRFFVAPILHTGASHLIQNGIALLIAGRAVERMIGWRWFVAVFGVSALAGSILSFTANGPHLVSVGASGGIVGVFVAGVTASFASPKRLQRRNVVNLAGGMLVLTLISPLRSSGKEHIDIAAHAGGAIGGLMTGFMIWMLWVANEPQPRGQVAAGCIALAYLGATMMAIGEVIF